MSGEVLRREWSHGFAPDEPTQGFIYDNRAAADRMRQNVADTFPEAVVLTRLVSDWHPDAAVPTPATDPADTEGVARVLLRALLNDFEADFIENEGALPWRNTLAQARSVTPLLTAAFERGRERGAGEVVARVSSRINRRREDYLELCATPETSAEHAVISAYDDALQQVAALRAGLAAGGA